MDKNVFCEECIFFRFFYDHDDRLMQKTALLDDLLGVAGECRKKTPVIFNDNSSIKDKENIDEYIYKHTAWPIVDQLSWCGEFKRKGG